MILSLAILSLLQAASGLAATPTTETTSQPDAGAPEPRLDCLPQRSGDLVALLHGQRFASQRDVATPGAATMMPITRGSPRWMSGFNAVLAWENDDCPAFAAFVEHMGYEAVELLDRRSGSRHWLLHEKAGRFNGLFVLRAPAERDKARPLVITAPHRGLSLDLDSAAQLYLATSAVALLQNSAHPCSLQQCGGCMMGESGLCGGCTRASDAGTSVDNLQFALFAALVATRRDLRLEYDALAPTITLPPGCRAAARLTAGPLSPATAPAPALADRVTGALASRLGAACVCNSASGQACGTPTPDSIFSRLANEEPLRPFDPCGQPATQLSGRYLHFAGRGVPVAALAAALAAALSQAPTPTATSAKPASK